MLEKANEIFVLLKKHNSGAITDSERKELQQLLNGSAAYQKLFDEFRDPAATDINSKIYLEQTAKLSDDDLSRIFDRALNEAKVERVNGLKRPIYRWFAAATVVLLIAFGVYLGFRPSGHRHQVAGPLPQLVNDVAPGSYKAKLTLADGSVVILDSAAIGELAKQGNVSVKNKNGQLVYDANGKNPEVLWNTLSTSIGESYSMLLSDGSRIWLNSGSNVKFPVTFAGNERVIEASGEIFLEVAKNPSRPFKVAVLQNGGKKCEVQVTGTSFNIMAYSDEANIETTLLEGKVVIVAENGKKTLVPGQQAVIADGGEIGVIKDVNTEVVTAWKDHTFYFKEADLKTMMRQLARWYGIQVEYKAAPPRGIFTGMVSRNTNLSEVLKMLEAARIPFRIEGKKLIIMSQ